MSIDKQKGIELRLQGYTQQETATALGCSLAWVKANLKGIKKPNVDQPLIDEIRRLGRLKEGITTGEIKQLVRMHYPAMTPKQHDTKVVQLKQSARKGNKDVVIRPYWLMHECPYDSINTMMDMSQHVYELMHELADKYRKLYDLDESYHKSIIYQLSALSAGDKNALLPQGIMTYGEHLGNIADLIDEREYID